MLDNKNALFLEAEDLVAVVRAVIDSLDIEDSTELTQELRQFQC